MMRRLFVVALILVLVPMVLGAEKVKPSQPFGLSAVPYHGSRQGVLFVQDGSGYGPAGTDPLWDATLTAILGAGNYGWFGPTTSSAENGPDVATMQGYDLVIWDNYDQWDAMTLTATDQSNIATYMAGGGKVWIIAPDALYSGVPQSFFTTNFDLASASQDYAADWTLTIQGLAECATSSFTITSDWINPFYADALTPTANGHAIVYDVGYAVNPCIISNDASGSFWTVDGRQPSSTPEWQALADSMITFLIGGGTTYNHDVGMISIDMAALVPENTTVNPMATVKNFGTNTETFDVTCAIDPGGFSSTYNVAGLEPDSTFQVTFPDAFTFVSGIYTVTVYTELGTDENLANDTLAMAVQATSWLYYDDGIAANAWAWYYLDNGWGVQFPVGAGRNPDLWVDSIAVGIWDISWPSPGGTSATFRIYDGAAMPTNLRWQIDTTVVRGAWNYYGVDTTLTFFTAGDNIYVFYIQNVDYPNCPGLSIDGAANYPSYMWQLLTGSFSVASYGGDWLIRAHILGYNPGVGEWVSYTPYDNLAMNVSTIVTQPDAQIRFTLPKTANIELNVYDAIGRLQQTIVSGRYLAGEHAVNANLDLAAGIYFYSLKTDTDVLVQKFLVVR